VDKEDCATSASSRSTCSGSVLAALEDTLELVRVHERNGSISPRCRPTTPRPTRMIQQADTIGTFQIESRAQMATLRA